jgi:hypothetical protein
MMKQCQQCQRWVYPDMYRAHLKNFHGPAARVYRGLCSAKEAPRVVEQHLIFRAWKHVNGHKVWAKDFGLRGWPIYVTDSTR